MRQTSDKSIAYCSRLLGACWPQTTLDILSSNQPADEEQEQMHIPQNQTEPCYFEMFTV